jgi:flagellar basal body-associated protein FliL
MNWLLGIVAVLAIIMFIVSGIQYITSVGNEEDATRAKNNMTYAIVGLVVALAGLIIVNAIAGITGAGGITNY